MSKRVVHQRGSVSVALLQAPEPRAKRAVGGRLANLLSPILCDRSLNRTRFVLLALGTLRGFADGFLSPATQFSRLGFEAFSVALSIAEQGTFGNPYSIPTGATAHVGPAYSAYLATLLMSLGNSPVMRIAAIAITALIFGVQLYLLPKVSEMLFRDSRPGVIAAFLCLFVPLYRMSPQWETIFFSGSLMIFCLASRPVAAGIAAAFAMLLNPAGLLFMLGWCAARVWNRDLRMRDCGVTIAVGFLLCAPWMIRNATTLGSFCLRDNLGLELWLYNNDEAQGSYALNRHLLAVHPTFSNPEAQEVRRVGEVAYNRQKLRSGADWIMAHPRRYAELSIQRWFFFWFPLTPGEWYGLGVWLVTAISLPAVIATIRRRSPASAITAGIILFSIPYCLINSDYRYREPILWCSVLFAGQTIASWAARSGQQTSVHQMQH